MAASPHPSPAPEYGSLIDPDSATAVALLLLQDHLFNALTGGPFPEQATLEGIKRILDLGCGPGAWAIDVPNIPQPPLPFSPTIMLYSLQSLLARLFAHNLSTSRHLNTIPHEASDERQRCQMLRGHHSSRPRWPGRRPTSTDHLRSRHLHWPERRGTQANQAEPRHLRLRR